MNTRAVVSREYKVMLKAEKFGGTPKQLLGNSRRLWADFLHAVESIVLETEGTLDKLEKQRLIVFLDSPGQHLRSGGYIFRVRRALDGDKAEVTLKFRHPDRYVAEGRQIKCPHQDQVRGGHQGAVHLALQPLDSGPHRQEGHPRLAERCVAAVSRSLEASAQGRRRRDVERSQRFHGSRTGDHRSAPEDWYDPHDLSRMRPHRLVRP